MNKKPYIAPKINVVLPELDDTMIGIDDGSATEVLSNDTNLDFEDNGYDPESLSSKGIDRTRDSL